METTNTTTQPFESAAELQRINHGHIRRDEATGQIVPDYKTWCGACRDALAKASR